MEKQFKIKKLNAFGAAKKIENKKKIALKTSSSSKGVLILIISSV